MRIWFDTEFIEDGKTIDLISIGAVREDGRAFYAENAECDRSRASAWVRENVFSKLSSSRSALMSRRKIADDFVQFVGRYPEFWANYCSYDWVVLCQLYGTMMDHPKHWPMFCMDLKQLCVSKGDPRLPEQPVKHGALTDARWCKAMWEYLQTL